MRLLINLCANDGIVSHYAGVGTMTSRYIEVITQMLKEKGFDYNLNLFTTIYNKESFGFNEFLLNKHTNLTKTQIFQVDNGTQGDNSFGSYENWKLLSQNTANLINNLKIASFDKVLTIANDIPYCDIARNLHLQINHTLIYIPHSTNLIFPTQNDDIAMSKEQAFERQAFEIIKKLSNVYVGAISTFMKEHIMQNYKLDNNKIVDLHNGEIFDKKSERNYPSEAKKLFNEINQYKNIIFSFGRCEKAKNLESTMLLGKELNIKAVVLGRTYGFYDPFVEKYQSVATETNSKLVIDPPFSASQYILENYQKKMIFLVPSIDEPMGLVVNECRRLCKDNILLVVNNSGGLKEQVQDEKDGLVVNLSDIKRSAKKILQHFNASDMQKFNTNAQKNLRKNYDLYKNMKNFLEKFI